MNTENNNIQISAEEYNLIMQSFDFIYNNRNITNTEIPEKYLHFWHIKDLTAYPNKNDAQTLIFMYILKLCYKSPEKIKKILSSPCYHHLFFCFQMIIATTIWSKKNRIEIIPFPIFDINSYQQSNLTTPEALLKQYHLIIQTQK